MKSNIWAFKFWRKRGEGTMSLYILTQWHSCSKVRVLFHSFQDHYFLRSFISHVGKSIRNGHYIACVRNGPRWYMMDDERVSRKSWRQENGFNHHVTNFRCQLLLRIRQCHWNHTCCSTRGHQRYAQSSQTTFLLGYHIHCTHISIYVT